MNKLATIDNGMNRLFKPQIFQSKKGNRVNIFMIHEIMIEGIIQIGTDQITEIGEFNLVDKVEVDQGINKIIGKEILEVT